MSRRYHLTGAISTARGAGISGAAFVISKGLYALLYLWIASIVAPSGLGSITLGLAVYAAFAPFRDFGLTPALVSKKELSPRLIASALSFRFAIALGLAAVGLVLAFILPEVFSQPDLLWILILITLTTLIEPIGFLSVALLQRELRFRDLATADILSVLAMAAAGAVSVFLGFQLFALFVGLVASAATRTVSCLLLRPVRSGLSRNLKEASSLIHYGSRLVATGITLYFYFNIIVWVLGSVDVYALGLYGFALLWASTPADISTAAISRVLLPTYANMKSDKERVVRAYIKTLRNVNIISLAGFLVLYVFCPIFIDHFYSDAWMDSIRILQILLLFGFMRVVVEPAGSMLLALERPGIILTASAIALVPMIVLAYPVSDMYSGMGCAWLLVLTYFFYLVIIWRYVLKLIGYSPTTIIGAIYRPIVAAATALALELVLLWAVPDLSEVLASVVVVLPMYLVLTYIMAKDDITEAAFYLKQSLRLSEKG